VLPEISKPAKTLLVQPTAKGQEALVGADQEFSTSEPLQAKAALDPANQEGKTESLPKGIILCPQCQAHLDISGVRSGEMVECKCGNRIAVPAKKRNLEMFIGAILVIACAAADAYPFDETLKSTLASIKFVLPVFSGATAIFGSWRICCMLAVASVLMQLGMEIPKFSTSSNPLFSAWNIIIILFYGWLAHSAWKKFRQINRKSK
ncbi:MAG: hypothetical protein NTX50_15180, partial [Candidatus Sumerlaeota bacterium]|nr:hypothetical protein [Candidatus Sumerlaeota bacterium]